MASCVNDSAVKSYSADMLREIGKLLEEAGNPLAPRAYALASDLEAENRKTEDRPTA